MLVAKGLGVRHPVVHGGAFQGLDPCKWGSVGSKRAKPSGNNDGPRENLGAVVSPDKQPLPFAAKARCQAFVTARTLMDGHSAYLNQAVLAEFMADGHFTVHIRRMRQLYKGRKNAFLDAFQRHLSPYATAGVANGGFQVACYLREGLEESATIKAAAAIGIDLPSLERLYFDRPLRSGWVMGYVALAHQEAEAAMKKLTRVLNRK